MTGRQLYVVGLLFLLPIFNSYANADLDPDFSGLSFQIARLSDVSVSYRNFISDEAAIHYGFSSGYTETSSEVRGYFRESGHLSLFAGYRKYYKKERIIYVF